MKTPSKDPGKDKTPPQNEERKKGPDEESNKPQNEEPPKHQVGHQLAEHKSGGRRFS